MRSVAEDPGIWRPVYPAPSGAFETHRPGPLVVIVHWPDLQSGTIRINVRSLASHQRSVGDSQPSGRAKESAIPELFSVRQFAGSCQLNFAMNWKFALEDQSGERNGTGRCSERHEKWPSGPGRLRSRIIGRHVPDNDG